MDYACSVISNRTRSSTALATSSAGAVGKLADRVAGKRRTLRSRRRFEPCGKALHEGVAVLVVDLIISETSDLFDCQLV
jgi:hypothetical protein